MIAFYSIASTITLIVVLLAVLRHRRHPLPLPLRIGAVVAPVGMIFPMAEQCLGAERLSEILTGPVDDTTSHSTFSVNNDPISESYLYIMSGFHAVTSIGDLLIAIGFLLLIQRAIRNHLSTLQLS